MTYTLTMDPASGPDQQAATVVGVHEGRVYVLARVVRRGGGQILRGPWVPEAEAQTVATFGNSANPGSHWIEHEGDAPQIPAKTLRRRARKAGTP